MGLDAAKITLDVISQKHPERTQWEVVWPDYRLAYEGGYSFLRAAGQLSLASNQTLSSSSISTTATPAQVAFNTPRRRFLRQLEGEPNAVYSSIWERAEYVNYFSAILDYFRHWLFSEPPNIRAADGDDPPDWFEDFAADANGSGESLIDFAKSAFLDVLLCRRSGWMVRSDPDEPTAAVLKQYKADEIVDWQNDAKGELEWVVLHKLETRREFPGERKQVEVYTYCDADQWAEWEVVKDEQGNGKLKVIDGGPHGIGKVPFVMFEVPHGLWIADKLFAWQIGLFNQWTRLKSAMLLGCIMQPYIKSNDPNASSRIFGEGILYHLRTAE